MKYFFKKGYITGCIDMLNLEFLIGAIYFRWKVPIIKFPFKKVNHL